MTSSRVAHLAPQAWTLRARVIMSGSLMQFLLLLSALLSAVTGVFGPRADMRVEQAGQQIAAVAQAAAPTRVIVTRPSQALPTLRAVARFIPSPRPEPARPVPLARVRFTE